MTHEEYLEMNDRVRKYVELNTKKSDLLVLKSNMNREGSISIVGSDRRIKSITDLDVDLHERIKEVINFEISRLVENIIREMHSI